VPHWSQRARADLKSIHDRIAQDAPGTAKAVVREFLARAGELPVLPRAGRVVPEVGDPDVREVPIHSWRLIYQVRGTEVFVLAIVQRMMAESLLRRMDMSATADGNRQGQQAAPPPVQ
jgi:addiction module RelE/StbE family toxin